MGGGGRLSVAVDDMNIWSLARVARLEFCLCYWDGPLWAVRLLCWVKLALAHRLWTIRTRED